MFLICHVTSREHMFRGLSEFIGGSPSRCLSRHLVMFSDLWSSASGNMKYLISHMTLKNLVDFTFLIHNQVGL